MLEIKNIKKFGSGDLRISRSHFMVGSEKKLFIMDGETDREVEMPFSVSTVCSADGKTFVGLRNGEVLEVSRDGEYKVLYKHENNVTALCYTGHILCSGGWDSNIGLYSNGNVSFIKYRTSVSILSMEILDQDRIIVGCSNGRLKIVQLSTKKFKTEICYNVYPVRQILCDGLCTYTLDNYGRLHQLNKDLKLVSARLTDEMTFAMTIWKDNVVVSGEGGKILLYTKDLKLLGSVDTNDTTIWSLFSDGEYLYAGGTKGNLYCLEFSNEKTKAVVEKEKTFRDFNCEGQRYRSDGTKLYKEENGKWVPFGNITPESYQHRFTVELSGKNYLIEFNQNEKPYDIAQRFLKKNNLPIEYSEEIVEFIEKNFRHDRQFKKIEGINMKGLKKLLQNHWVMNLLEEIELGVMPGDLANDSFNLYHIEMILMTIDEKTGLKMPTNDIPLFATLDIIRYLTGLGIKIDLSFMYYVEIKTAKEARTYLELLINAIPSLPFSLKPIEYKIQRLIEEKLITNEALLKDYQNNLGILEKH